MAPYDFSDPRTQEALLHEHGPHVDLKRAVDLMRKRVDRFYNGTSKFFPHQGEKEMAKRRGR